jgi:hypothetical protein
MPKQKSTRGMEEFGITFEEALICREVRMTG